ncbi:hypothetical protein Golob_005945, partial [Gossypium lobatum]|nr:hypothetical protein [Gossypium lobatum]
QLTSIYVKDRVTGKYVQIATDIFEELRSEDVAKEEGSNENRYEFDASLDEMNVSATQSQLSNPNKVDTTFSKKKKKSPEASEPNSSTSLIDVAMLLRNNIRIVGLKLSRSIASEMFIKEKSSMIIQEKVQTLHVVLGEIEGLIDDERIDALTKIPNHPTQMLIFLSLPHSMRLAWVRKFISSH